MLLLGTMVTKEMMIKVGMMVVMMTIKVVVMRGWG